MNVLHRNDFIEISLDKANNIIEMAWLPGANFMSDDDYKAAFTKYAELAEEHHPLGLLTYSRGSAYTILPHLQEWTIENIIPRAYNAGIRYTAIVVLEDAFAQISAEQLVKEPEVQQAIQTRFFPSVEAAREWLLRMRKKQLAQL